METQLIYLVRHGETDANLQNIYQGRSIDQHLNANGLEQAGKLALFLAKEAAGVNKIYTSPMMRAMDTMAVIADALSAENKRGSDGQILPKMIIEHDLEEIDHGDWDGKTPQEVIEIWPDVVKEWWYGDPTKVKFPGGESVKQAKRRAWHTFKKIALENYPNNVIISAHGGINSMILGAIKKQKFRTFKQVNTCLNIIEHHGNAKFKAKLINFSDHLAAAQEAQK